MHTRDAIIASNMISLALWIFPIIVIAGPHTQVFGPSAVHPLPPISKGPPNFQLPPTQDHQVIFMHGKAAPQMEEIVLAAPPRPLPSLTQMMPTPLSPYVPPTLVEIPPQPAWPVTIHAANSKLPAVPSILPTKHSRISSPAWRPVAVVAGPTKGQFTRVGRVPSKQGPFFPSPVNIRPMSKGEM